MNYAVIKATGYILINTPDMLLSNGTTQITERLTNPDSEYLKKIHSHIRDFNSVLNYAPNQVYIGNLSPEKLRDYEIPWFDKTPPKASRHGKYGEIMPQDEFIALLKISDVFDLVKLSKEFTGIIKTKISNHPFLNEYIDKLKEGEELLDIQNYVEGQKAQALYHEGRLVGCIKRAHDLDVNLNAQVLLNNLTAKASGILAFKHMLYKNNIDVADIDYVIECSEEASGDMNQRGGGNFAKAIAESVGAINATGSDLRGFCAAPTHALIEAAALVQSGTFNNVCVVAGGSMSKLGMNGKDHVNSGIPILEDVLGGFAILVSKDDGVNPILRTDLVGRHTVGVGSAPQAVITALVTTPLDKGGLKLTDIDKYSVEMQNPDITRPVGAGDVAEANYRMIAALGVQRNELNNSETAAFIEKHGMPGWAPTQGHIPSGVPYVGLAKDELTIGNLNKVMVIGKGSLFQGRMTNLFDGVSIILERNPGKSKSDNLGINISEEDIKHMIAEAMKDFASHLLKE